MKMGRIFIVLMMAFLLTACGDPGDPSGDAVTLVYGSGDYGE